MTIRYEKWKDGVKHYYWLGNISKIEVITIRNKAGLTIGYKLDILIESGMVTDEYIIKGVQHWSNTYINTPQHFTISSADTRRHLRLYL